MPGIKDTIRRALSPSPRGVANGAEQHHVVAQESVVAAPIHTPIAPDISDMAFTLIALVTRHRPIE